VVIHDNMDLLLDDDEVPGSSTIATYTPAVDYNPSTHSHQFITVMT